GLPQPAGPQPGPGQPPARRDLQPSPRGLPVPDPARVSSPEGARENRQSVRHAGPLPQPLRVRRCDPGPRRSLAAGTIPADGPGRRFSAMKKLPSPVLAVLALVASLLVATVAA